jgi:hypothetical protein
LPDRLGLAGMQLAGKQCIAAYRTMCAILEFQERVRVGYATGQILGSVHAQASTNRGCGLSLEKGTEP